jgi:MFS family permease
VAAAPVTDALVFSGITLALLGATRSAGIALVLGFLVGSSQAMFMSMTLAIIQSSVEDEYRGRATSFYQLITLTPMALFGWGRGGLADITEPRPLNDRGRHHLHRLDGDLRLLLAWLRGLLGPTGWRPTSAAGESAGI